MVDFADDLGYISVHCKKDDFTLNIHRGLNFYIYVSRRLGPDYHFDFKDFAAYAAVTGFDANLIIWAISCQTHGEFLGRLRLHQRDFARQSIM